VRREELENVIGFDENFQMREGDAAGGIAGIGELRVSITVTICCAIEQEKEVRGCARAREDKGYCRGVLACLGCDGIGETQRRRLRVSIEKYRCNLAASEGEKRGDRRGGSRLYRGLTCGRG
jgi:hypothetical protein